MNHDRQIRVDEDSESAVESKFGKYDKKAEKKRLKKLEQSLKDETLDPGDRYRALSDLLKQFMDIVAMLERKTRFALVILGALNAVNLIVIGRPELVLGTQGPAIVGIGIYAGGYVAISLFLVVQAIRALKPRMSNVKSAVKETEGQQEVLGLRFVHIINSIGFEEYYRRWHDATYSQVNRDIALVIRANSEIIDLKYRALNRLYSGLLILVFLTGGLILAIVYTRLF